MPFAHGLRKDHVSLIARTYAKHSIRGGSGLMFTLVTLVVGLTIASLLVTFAEELHRENLRQNADARTADIVTAITDKYTKPVVQWALGTDDEHTTYLVDTKPALVSAILIIMLISIPFLASFGAFNQLSGDIQNKGLRYVLLRTERINIILGRFIGTFVFNAVVLAILMGIILLYMIGKARLYDAGDVAIWMAQGYLAMVLLSIPYIAFCTWLSALIDSPFLSFFISQAVVGFLPLIAYLGQRVSEHVKYVAYATPWPFKFYLIHPNVGWVLGAAGIMLGFTAIFLFLGIKTFQTRDL